MTSEIKLPAVMVVMQDKEFARRHPDKAFYLRVARSEHEIDAVDLPGAVTPLDGRRIARDLGYEPTHWIQPNSTPSRF
ncbi:hypothetical protein AB4Y45_33300 [Paraburkholderia sp. EG287A]|uniref:hypothetical protein n=1 Tax=Paraburkholderia sp. EG287A TaxID=3237012 RepID=UPI0034D36351